MKGNFLPEYGKYRVIIRGKSIGWGVYVGSNSGKHNVLMRINMGVTRYSFRLPSDPSDFDPNLSRYEVNNQDLTLPSRATKSESFSDKEREPAHKTLERRGL